MVAVWREAALTLLLTLLLVLSMVVVGGGVCDCSSDVSETLVGLLFVEVVVVVVMVGTAVAVPAVYPTVPDGR